MSVSSSYSRALLEGALQAGKNSAQLDEIQAQLSQMAETISSSKELRMVLQSPATSSREKEKVVEALASHLKVDDFLKRFLLLLARKERVTIIQDVAAAFQKIRLETQGGLLGQLKSASVLTPQEIQEVSAAFEKKTGKKVQFNTEVDRSLIAGVSVTLEGITYDGSLKTQLNRLKDQFLG
jgi:F-type H+-transporting ATPase subunit delta